MKSERGKTVSRIRAFSSQRTCAALPFSVSRRDFVLTIFPRRFAKRSQNTGKHQEKKKKKKKKKKKSHKKEEEEEEEEENVAGVKTVSE